MSEDYMSDAGFPVAAWAVADELRGFTDAPGSKAHKCIDVYARSSVSATVRLYTAAQVQSAIAALEARHDFDMRQMRERHDKPTQPAPVSGLSGVELEAWGFMSAPGTHANLRAQGFSHYVPQIEAICAALRRLAAPRDWVSVPREPTEAMLQAGGKDSGWCHCCGYGNGDGDCARLYADMLAAAPLAAGDEGNGDGQA